MCVCVCVCVCVCGLVKYGLVCTSELSHTSEVSQPSLAKAAEVKRSRDQDEAPWRVCALASQDEARAWRRNISAAALPSPAHLTRLAISPLPPNSLNSRQQMKKNVASSQRSKIPKRQHVNGEDAIQLHVNAEHVKDAEYAGL